MENCPICLNEMTLETSVSTMCNHQYCETCLNTWLENHNTCPLCRYEIHEDDPVDSDYDPDSDAELPEEYVALVRGVVFNMWGEIWQGLMNQPQPVAGNFFERRERFVIGARFDRDNQLQNEQIPLLEEDALQQHFREEEARAEQLELNTNSAVYSDGQMKEGIN